jgi:hypothetical protein
MHGDGGRKGLEMVGDGWKGEQSELGLIANWVVNNKLLERDRLRGCGGLLVGVTWRPGDV